MSGASGTRVLQRAAGRAAMSPYYLQGAARWARAGDLCLTGLEHVGSEWGLAFYSVPAQAPSSGTHSSQAGSGSGCSEPLLFAGRSAVADSKRPAFHRPRACRERAGPCALHGVGACPELRHPRFTGRQQIGLHRTHVFYRAARADT